MEFEFIRYEKRDRIAYVTINRPEVMNALHPPAHEELARVWDDVVTDPEIWVAILTGTGDRAFSAGNDLKWTTLHGVPRMPKGGFGGLVARDDLWKPLIAAVNGFALGGGLELALACDVIIAAEHARLGLPEPRVGLMAAAGGVHRLPRHVPLKVAMGMILTGRPVSAAEAARIGRRGAMGTGDERMLPARRAGLKAGGTPGSRAAGRRGDAGALPAGAEALHERGRRRGSARLCREAEAGLAGTVSGAAASASRRVTGRGARCPS